MRARARALPPQQLPHSSTTGIHLKNGMGFNECKSAKKRPRRAALRAEKTREREKELSFFLSPPAAAGVFLSLFLQIKFFEKKTAKKRKRRRRLVSTAGRSKAAARARAGQPVLRSCRSLPLSLSLSLSYFSFAKK